MPEVNNQQGLLPSLLDRLLDPESMGTIAHPGSSLSDMIDAVRADLEDLLNTRLTQPYFPAREYPETANSIVTFGLPDLTSLNAVTALQRAEIGKVIEGTVARFEPRLRAVRATLVGGNNKDDRSLRFHIDARLCLDPAPEVAFETVLELSTGQASVKPSDV